ncbi:MAG: 23S rRNA (pseudouridine(1915)-N(3))-methyltransferase RlmH [Candidatus Cloacimonadota bacterium]|nr:MAG: 23S rRNA (pseudouridine(1915)-N(3))-methyltransferase RlmH [Candidatus Cloacimonadota bacterium]PIE78084.1 MAG: 23S rRNA (pseudouridine(1915)-N(3))-methyltransferase RlmH [Candidatus Delongbacteria bacterium]
MKISIIGVGKTKFDYLNSGIERFVKMIKPMAKIEFIILKEQSSKSNCVELESNMILKSIPKDFRSILLDVKGSRVSSHQFANIISKEKDNGKNICFITGGHLGVSENLKRNVDLKISISDMTFTHQMVRLLLIEQIYRGFSIINNLNYHK